MSHYHWWRKGRGQDIQPGDVRRTTSADRIGSYDIRIIRQIKTDGKWIVFEVERIVTGE
jgi:hypothetical protein